MNLTPQWIPCSQRLPERQGVYLVCRNGEHPEVGIACFKREWVSTNAWGYAGMAVESPTHWLEVPPPDSPTPPGTLHEKMKALPNFGQSVGLDHTDSLTPP